MVLPLRDCLSQELNLLCSLDWLVTEEVIVNFLPVFLFIFSVLSLPLLILIFIWQGSLKTVEVLCGSRSGINGLVSSFVKLLQVKVDFCISIHVCTRRLALEIICISLFL